MIEPRRLARAVHLEAEPLPDGRTLVTGGRTPHLVNLGDVQAPCDCADVAFRPGVTCAHQLAALLRVGDLEVVRALRQLVPDPNGRRRRRAR
jgi:hypothetical protein